MIIMSTNTFNEYDLINELKKLSIPELKKTAKTNGIIGYSNKNKAVIIDLIFKKHNIKMETTKNDISEINKKHKCLIVSNINNKLLEMPYFKNYAACGDTSKHISSHEDAVKDILLSENLKQFVPPKQKQETIYSWIENPLLSDIMPINTFISQPCGSQQSPDFIVKFEDGSILPIECKSSNSTIPLYNSGGIKPNYFYIFSSKILNKTVTYMGYNIINEKQQKLIDEHIKDARKRDEILNTKLKECDTNGRGVCYYTRPMIGQGGGCKYTNYFTHVNKENDCKSILEFIKK